MSEPTPHLCPWYLQISQDETWRIHAIGTDELIATLAKPGADQLKTALVISTSPVLVSTLMDCGALFRLIAKEQSGELHDVAFAMFQRIDAVLENVGIGWENNQQSQGKH